MASSTASLQPQPQLLTLPAYHRASLAHYLPSHPPFPPNHAIYFEDQPTTFSSTPLPHLTLTYASSLDASIALAPGLQTALSGPETKAMTHFLRSQHDAILVGANTAIIDDPSLNCRHVGPGEGQPASQPIPIILDPSARWGAPYESKVLRLAREGRGRGPLWVVERCWDDDAHRRVLEAKGDVIVLGSELRRPSGSGGVDWRLLLDHLAARGIRSVMVEGGARVIVDLLGEGNRGFVSSVVVTVAPVWLGEGGVVVSPPRPKGEEGREVGRLVSVRWVPMGEDVVMAGRFAEGSQ